MRSPPGIRPRSESSRSERHHKSRLAITGWGFISPVYKGFIIVFIILLVIRAEARAANHKGPHLVEAMSICHGCFLRPHFLPLVKRNRSGSEREIEARPQTDLNSENKSTDGGRSRIPTTWARVSIEPLLLLFVTMWAWWWWSGISSLLTGGHKPPSWVRIWERVGFERSLYGGANLVGFKSVRMACELVQDHKIWKTSVWFSRIRVTCCQIGRLGVLVHYSSHDDKNKEIRVKTLSDSKCQRQH